MLDDFLPERTGPGRKPKITDAELIALAIAQVFLVLPTTASSSASQSGDGLRLLDSTPVGALRRLARDGQALRVAGGGAYGYCQSHSRFF